jgi:hypothetical protein
MSNVVGYAFEPIRYDREVGDDNNNNNNQQVDNIEVNLRDRLSNTNWCSCGHCAVNLLVSNLECICCKEINCVETRAFNYGCITFNPRFHAICIDPEALETALSGMSASRGNSLNWHLIKPIYSRFVKSLII